MDKTKITFLNDVAALRRVQKDVAASMSLSANRDLRELEKQFDNKMELYGSLEGDTFFNAVSQMREAQREYRAHHGKKDSMRVFITEGAVDYNIIKLQRQVALQVTQGDLFEK